MYSDEICEKLDVLDGCRYIRIFDKEEVDIPQGTTPSDAILKNPLRGNVGKYCSFAGGVNLVANHPINFVTTSPILYDGFRGRKNDLISTYHIGVLERKYKTEDFNKEVNIGNDVWLGENVLIQNGVTIGDGCIIGSGAVVTRNIPDYAIAVGVPAKVIRYRFEEEEIEKLKKIAWWDWTTEKIKENYEDFFDVKEFINKHYK